MRTGMRVGFMVGAGALLLAALAEQVSAGVLSGDVNGMSGWSDTRRMDGPMTWAIIAVDVDYCVYAPGQFELSFPGQDPTGGTEYVYAYQIFNDLDPHPVTMPGFNPDYVGRFSVGLDADEGAGNGGYVAGTGAAPSDVDTIGAASTQAGWDFTDAQMHYPSVSAVLFFTSPNLPELDTATASGAYPTNPQTLPSEMLPSPSNIPEPATLALLGTGITLEAGRRRRR